ncbi:hypothetical protein CEXT_289221 [Caerostris extrusa]|uniref:Uncharacterized protein n=1 Tax=Caerostris extrusa TaxID=172846 RepID=A0AAV4RM06_CAEEX|nr:hypothetical protein CEXT_289221 [Caerostris extrusa]
MNPLTECEFSLQKSCGKFPPETSVGIRWRNAEQRLTATVASSQISVPFQITTPYPRSLTSRLKFPHRTNLTNHHHFSNQSLFTVEASPVIQTSLIVHTYDY